MKREWKEAGGQYQIPLMGAASRTLKGERNILCPKCREGILRCYYHVFNTEKLVGTIWVWCPRCRTTCHLPRIRPAPNYLFQDPFNSLGLKEFVQLEQDEAESLFDKLDRLWEEGSIGFPEVKH